MATLDSYLQAQLSHNATHFVLHAGHEIIFVIDGVERPMTAEKVDQATVVALLSQIAPDQTRRSIQANGKFEFRYSTKNSPFLCSGHPTATGPRAVFTIGETFFAPDDPASIVDSVSEPMIHRLFRIMVEKKSIRPPSVRGRAPHDPRLRRHGQDRGRAHPHGRIAADLLFEIAPR